MRILQTTIIAGALFAVGCGWGKGDGQKGATTKGAEAKGLPWNEPGAPDANPDAGSLRGKVAKVNDELGFVVLDFTFSRLPEANRRLGVFREGRRVGQLTTTAMSDDAYLVADINKGDIRQGDDVRQE